MTVAARPGKAGGPQPTTAAAFLGGGSPLPAGARGSRPVRPRPSARSTIARKLSVVRSFLRFCEDNGLVEASPAAGVAPPRCRGACLRC